MSHAIAFESAGHAEIHDQNATGFVAHDVLRLQVAVNDANAMSGFERAADLLDDLDCFFGRKYFVLKNQRAQVFALDELHGDELNAVGVAKVIDADDVFVRDLMGKEKLLLEAGDNRGIGRKLTPNEFQGDEAVEFAVAGLVDRAHAAFAQQLQDLVATGHDITGIEQRDIGLRAQGAGTGGRTLPGAFGHGYVGVYESGVGVNARTCRTWRNLGKNPPAWHRDRPGNLSRSCRLWQEHALLPN